MKFKLSIIAFLLAASGLQAQVLTLVKDINPGSSGAVGMFHKALVFDNRLYFTANDGIHGEEFWSTDGTEGGTEMLMDIHAGAQNATPDYTQYGRFPGMCEFDGFLYFTANADNFGEELWRTNGIAGNTTMCQEVYPGFMDASPTFFHKYKDLMFFTAIHPEYQREPFVLRHDELNNDEPLITSLGDLFSINSVLTTMWNTYSPENSGNVITFMDTLIFRWYGLGSGLETWITNGTPQGTSILYDNYEVSNLELGSAPSGYSVLQDTILCYNAENQDGEHVWTIKRDPSFPNAFVNSIIATPNSAGYANIQELFVHEDQLYFSADDGVHGQELWVSNGTFEGTFMLKDIVNGSSGSYPKNFVSYDGNLYFTTFDGFDEGHIWISDGTEDGTFSAADIWNSALTRSYANMNWIEYNGKLYYPAFNSQMSEHYLCVTDGSAEGTNWVVPSNGGGYIQLFNSFNKFIVMNNELYFIANPSSGETGPEVYKLTDDNVSYLESIEIERQMKLYPNPSCEELTILLSDGSKLSQIEIVNLDGKLISQHLLTQTQTTLDISGLMPGVYIVKYACNDYSRSLRFVKH